MVRVTSMMLVAPQPSGLGDAADSDREAFSGTNSSGVPLSPDELGTGNTTSTYDLWKDGEALQSIYLGYLWLSLFIGLPGNILIAVVYVVVRHKRTCDWFIFYLSVYDCAVCLFAVPLYLSIETGVWESTGSDLACKLEQFIIFTSQFSSVFILGIIAVDRYLKICHPTKRSLNALQARNIGVGTLVLAGVIAAPLLVWEGNVDRKFCRIQARYRHTLGVKIHLCSTLGFFIVIFVLVIFCYSQVVLAVRRRIQRHRENALKRKHLLQIPAFIQAISNVDETPENSDPKLSKGKRKFSLFNIGSSRRLSVIAPWVKARLSLPNDTTSGGGVSSRSASRAGSRASGASSTSSISFNHRRKKKKSISTSAMILSEKGESGADDENKDALCAERNNTNASDDERKPGNDAKVSNGCGFQRVPDKVVVTDTGNDTEREETFSLLERERSRPVPPLFKQDQINDLDLVGREFQCVSDRGRTLGAAFLFADAPVRRSLEEEWELEMARVARERRISTDSALKRPEDKVKVTVASALFTWISKLRRKARSNESRPKGRLQSADTRTGSNEETEKLFKADMETSLSTVRVQNKSVEKLVSRQRGEHNGSRISLSHTPIRIEVSPSTPKSSLRQIGRQKTSIEETALASDLVSAEISNQRFLQADPKPQVQGSSDSTSSCLSLFDHVVCVHQAQSPLKKVFQETNDSPSLQPNGNETYRNLISSNHKASNHSINGYSPLKSLNKSDTLLTKNRIEKFPGILNIKKSKSLYSSMVSYKSNDTSQSTNSRQNVLDRKVIDSSNPLCLDSHCQRPCMYESGHLGTSGSSQSLPESFKNLIQHSDQDLSHRGFKPSRQKGMLRPFSFPLVNSFNQMKLFSESKKQRDIHRCARNVKGRKRSNRDHIPYRLLRLSRENSFEENKNHSNSTGEYSINYDCYERNKVPIIDRHVNSSFPMSHSRHASRSADLTTSNLSGEQRCNFSNGSNDCSEKGGFNSDIFLRNSNDSVQRTVNCPLALGIMRSLSDKGQIDKKRDQLAVLPSNQLSLSAQHISVNNDLQNSDLYRRRMSPKREKNQRYSSKSAEVLNTPSGVRGDNSLDTILATIVSAVHGKNQETSEIVDDPTSHSSIIRSEELSGELTSNNKKDESLESPNSESSQSCYASALAFSGHNHNSSASYISCNSSLCSNNVFTYPAYKTHSQPSEECFSHNVIETRGGVRDENEIIDKGKKIAQTETFQKADNLETKCTGPNFRKPVSPSQPPSSHTMYHNDASVVKGLEGRHLFNNTSGCHSLYSPLESPQNDLPQSSNQPSQSFAQNIQLNQPQSANKVEMFKNENYDVESTNNLSYFGLLPYMDPTNSSHTASHDFKSSNESLVSFTHSPYGHFAPTELHRFHLISTVTRASVNLKTISCDPFSFTLCLIQTFLDQLTHNDTSITQRTLMYDVKNSITCLLPSCFFRYPISVANLKCSSHSLKDYIFPAEECYSFQSTNSTILPSSISTTLWHRVMNATDGSYSRPPMNETIGNLRSSLASIASNQHNENFPYVNRTSPEDFINTFHSTNRPSVFSSTCPSNAQYKQLIDTLCFNLAEKTCSSAALSIMKLSPYYDFYDIYNGLLHELSNVFYSNHVNQDKRGILCWSLHNSIAWDLIPSFFKANSFFLPVNDIISVTCQSKFRDNDKTPQTRIADEAVNTKPETSTENPIGNVYNYKERLTKTVSANSSLAHLLPSSNSNDAASTPPPKIDKDSISKYINAAINSQAQSPEKKKRTWSLSKAEGGIFKFRKSSGHPRTPKNESGCFPLAGSPHVKRTSLRKKAVIAAGIRDSILVETVLSHIATSDSADTKERGVGGTLDQMSHQHGEQGQEDQGCHSNGAPRVPPSSFPEDMISHFTTKTVHSALLKCVPTAQSPSDHCTKYHPTVSASGSIVNTPTSTGSATPSSTCEIFVRSVFDAFVTPGNGFISSSEPCLPIFSSPGNVEYIRQGEDMLPLDVPLTPLLARNDNHRRSASNRGGVEEGESSYRETSASGTKDGTTENYTLPAMSAMDSKLYQLVRQNREALRESNTCSFGSPTCMSPGASSNKIVTSLGDPADRDTNEPTPRSRKQSTLSHSWFSLDDLESTRKPSRFRLRSFYYLNSLRHQIERAFSLGHIRSFLGLGEADVRKRRNASRKIPRDTLAANQINVIITRCESIVLDRSAEEMSGQPFRDRSSSLDPCTGDPPCTSGTVGGVGVDLTNGVSDSLDQWDINLLKHHNFQHRHSADAASTTSSTNRANFDRMGKPRAASLDTARGSSFSQSDDMSSRGASLDLLSPASASIRTGSVCSGMSTLSRLTECSAYTENSRSDCERITRRSAEREHNITKLLGVITFIFVISWSVSWGVIIGDTLGLTPGSSHATVTYSGTTQEGHSPPSGSPASNMAGDSVNSGRAADTSSSGGDLHSTASPATHLTVSLARNLFLVNHFCNIVVYAWLSKSFREKLAECYKIVSP